MKKSNIILFFIGFVFLIAALTNPAPEKHKEHLKNQLILYAQKSIKQNRNQSDIKEVTEWSLFEGIFQDAMAKGMINSLVTTDDYVFFSITKFQWDGEITTIGFGAFGNIFLSRKLKKHMDDFLQSSLNDQN